MKKKNSKIIFLFGAMGNYQSYRITERIAHRVYAYRINRDNASETDRENKLYIMYNTY